MYAAHRGHVESVKVLLADRRTNVILVLLLMFWLDLHIVYSELY